MNLTEEIKARLDMDDVFARYGLEQNRAGFIVCPFHSEKTASLSAYDSKRRWKCFGCGEGGDVIRFVMLLHGISFRQALIRINNDFGLGLTASEGDPRSPMRAREQLLAVRRAREEKRKRLRAEITELCLIHRTLNRARNNEKPLTPDDPPSAMFLLSLAEMDWVADQITRLGKELDEMG